jgi:hypothetical protein
VPEWEDPENKKGGEWSVRKGMSIVDSFHFRRKNSRVSFN